MEQDNPRYPPANNNNNQLRLLNLAGITQAVEKTHEPAELACNPVNEVSEMGIYRRN